MIAQSLIHCLGGLTPHVANSFGIRLYVCCWGTSSCNDKLTCLQACTNVDTIMAGLEITMDGTNSTDQHVRQCTRVPRR
jgi:hypothetical protein